MEEWAIHAILTAWIMGAVVLSFQIGRWTLRGWAVLACASVAGLALGQLMLLASDRADYGVVVVIAGLCAIAGYAGIYFQTIRSGP